MVRVPHHDPEHGRRVRAGLRVSLPSIFLGVVSPSNHSRTLSAPYESLRAVSLSNRSNRFMAQTALKPHLILDDDNSLD